MKTIQFIIEAIKKMEKLCVPADINIGTFKVTSTGNLYNYSGNRVEYKNSIVTFSIEFKPSHIQNLINLGKKSIYCLFKKELLTLNNT